MPWVTAATVLRSHGDGTDDDPTIRAGRRRSSTTTTMTRTTRAPRARGHDRGQRPLAVHPLRRDGGRARDRPAAAARPAPRCRRVRCDDHRPHRGHGRLRPGLRAGQPRRPAARPTARSSASAPPIADRLLEQYDVNAVWVKAAKPEPPFALPVDRGLGRGLARGRAAVSEARGPDGYLGLGSNIGDRRAHLQAAVAALPGAWRRGAGLLLDLRDRAGRAGPRPGRVPQRLPARSRPSSSPSELLDACKAVEREVGRAAGGPRHGPRVIDVDLLLLGELEFAPSV